MDPFNVDMELLRRIGVARETVESVRSGDATAADLRRILADVRTQMSEDFTFLQGLFRSLEEGSESTDEDRLGRATLEALDAAESLLFGEEEAEAAEARVLETLAPLLAGPGAEGRRDDGPDPDDAAAGADDPVPGLDGVALLLARAVDDPDALQELHAALEALVPLHPELADPFRSLADSGDDDETLAALAAVGSAVEAVMAGLPLSLPEDDVETGPPRDRPRAAAPAPPDPAPTPVEDAEDLQAPDPDLLRDFLEEGNEHLDSAEVALLTLEENPGDDEAVNVVFRAFHTIKGVAGFMNLHGVADMAHLAESLLSRVRDGEIPFTPGIADLTLRSADVLRALLEGVRPLLDGAPAVVPADAARVSGALRDEALVQHLAGEPSARVGLPAPGAEADAPSGSADGTAATPPRRTGGTGGEETVRVRTDRLDRLVDLVGELVVAHSMVAQDPELRGRQSELGRKVDHSAKILRELQDLSTTLRMVPLQGAFNRMARVVRDLSRKSGKRVRLVTSGENTELDRGMVDVITDPLVHMVRNAVDHAVEPPEERSAAGKPAEAELRLSAYQANGGVVIEVKDDGRGLSRERILARAVERGLVDPGASLSDKEVWALIFAAGFSTAERVTEVSGRGVGMDVVRRSVESLRGVVDVESAPGVGTTFYIRLPLTLAITEGMLLSVGRERYIVPMTKIRESFRPRPEHLTTVVGRGECVEHHGELLPLHRLGRLYGVSGAVDQATEGLVVVVGDGRRMGAILVDGILDQQSFVVKPLSGLTARVPGLSGGAILGDGSVGLIVDPDEIIDAVRRKGARAVA